VLNFAGKRPKRGVGYIFSRMFAMAVKKGIMSFCWSE